MPTHNESPKLPEVKVLPPRPPQHWVKRWRLMQSLQKSVDDGCHVFFLMAPTGFGKTVALQEFAGILREQDRNVVWLTRDVNDTGALNFRCHILAALVQSGINIAPSEQNHLLNMAGCNADRFASSLSAEVQRQGYRVALIVDEVKGLETEGVKLELAALCHHAQDHMMVVVASRTRLQLGTAKLYSQGRLQGVTANDLRFDLAEVQNLIPQIVPEYLSKSEVQQLLEKTAGWPALITITLKAKSRAGLGQTSNDRTSAYGSAITSFLTDEVLGPLTPLQRQKLRTVAIASRLCDELIRAITNSKVTANELHELPDIGLLIQNLDAHGQWFRIHPLLRDLLLAELCQQPRNEICQLYDRASQWCYNNNLLSDAIGFFIDNHRYDRALKLLIQHGQEIIGKGELDKILTLMRRLPAEIISENLDILLQQAWHYLLANETHLSNVLQQEIRQRSMDHPMSPLANFSMNCMQTTTYLFQERHDEALKLGLSLLEGDFEPPNYLYNTLRIMIAQSYINTGKMSEAIVYIKQCQVDSTEPSANYSVFSARVALVLCYLIQADDHNLQREYNSLCRWFSSLSNPAQGLQDTLLTVNGIMAYLSGDLERARVLFQNSKKRTFLLGEPSVVGWISFFLSRTYYDLGEISLAMQTLQEALHVAERNKTASVAHYINGELIRLARLIGDKDTATSALNKIPITKKTGRKSNRLFLNYVDYCSACTLIGQKNSAQFAVKLKEIIHGLQKAGYRFQQVEMMLTLAEGYWLVGDREKAVGVLKDAMLADDFVCCDQLFRSRLATLDPLYNEIRLTTASPVLLERIKRIFTNYRQPTVTREGLLVPLTKAEIRVANCLQQGMSNKAIADQLFVSINTVKTHLKSIYAKLGVANRTHAIKYLGEYSQ